MQFQKKMKKNLAAAVLAGLIVTPYGTPLYAVDAAAAETRTEAAAPSIEETLAEWMATHPTQDTAVSIHAPRAGRDGKRSYDFPLLPHIYGYYSPQI